MIDNYLKRMFKFFSNKNWDKEMEWRDNMKLQNRCILKDNLFKKSCVIIKYIFKITKDFYQKIIIWVFYPICK